MCGKKMEGGGFGNKDMMWRRRENGANTRGRRNNYVQRNLLLQAMCFFSFECFDDLVDLLVLGTGWQ